MLFSEDKLIVILTTVKISLALLHLNWTLIKRKYESLDSDLKILTHLFLVLHKSLFHDVFFFFSIHVF